MHASLNQSYKLVIHLFHFNLAHIFIKVPGIIHILSEIKFGLCPTGKKHSFFFLDNRAEMIPQLID